MELRESPDHTDDERESLGALMERTWGVMRRAELEAVGVGERALASRRASGELIRAAPGAYVAASVQKTPESDLRIALASLGDRYCAAHLSAAFHHGLLRFPPEQMHVARREMWGHNGLRADLVLHRFGDLGPDDIEDVRGVRITTVERTLLDLAATARKPQDHRLLRYALRIAMRNDDGLAARLEAKLERRGRRRGTRILRDAIEEWRLTGVARSLTEIDFIDFYRRNDLPLPRTNVVVDGVERDAVWHEHKVIGEIDTRQHHDGDDVSFEESRLRDAESIANGWRVVHVTPRAMTRDEAKQASIFRRLLVPRAA